VLGPAVVRPLFVAGLDGWRPAEVGDRQPVLQLRVHGRERGRAKRGGRHRRIQNSRIVRRLVPRRSDGSHGGVDGERLERRGCGEGSAIVFHRAVVVLEIIDVFDFQIIIGVCTANPSPIKTIVHQLLIRFLSRSTVCPLPPVGFHNLPIFITILPTDRFIQATTRC